MFGIDLIGLISLLLIVWGVMGIMQSGASDGAKLVWIIVIILMPILGFVIWYVAGPGSKAFPLRR